MSRPFLSCRQRGLLATLALMLLSLACAAVPEETGAGSAPAEPLELRSVDPPAGGGAMAPRLTPAPEGPLLTWLEPVDPEAHDHYRLLLSRLGSEGSAWGPPQELAAGDDFFANWADVPGAAEAGGQIVAHWLEKLGEGPYAYGVQLIRSRDDGRTWERTGLLHDDDSPQEHGFVSWLPLPGGALQAFWLDGRAMGGEGEGGGGEADGGHGHGGGAMQLRTTRVEDGLPVPSVLLDDRVCECCPTAAALTSEGPLVVYRGRSEGEIRDIRVVRAVGEAWSLPALVHEDGWEIHGCPVNGPAVAAEGDRVAVAWFTGAQGRAQVLAAFSHDGGARFGEPVEVDADQPLGRVDVVMSQDEGAYVSWIGMGPEGAELRLRHVTSAGASGPPRGVSATTARRSAGMPRMARHGGELLFAWVEDTSPARLRVAAVDEAAVRTLVIE